jgi:UDP-glucose 4-epimerase
LSHLVTGVAGFIGSHLAERLVALGRDVLGVDSFTDYYSRKIKESNISSLQRKRGFKFVEMDLSSARQKGLMDGIEVVFHLAAQPGVRASWGDTFEYYTRDNILATQHLLESAKDAGIMKFIYASSSSIYGDSERLPCSEDAIPRPNSPYGVTKLAGEHLCEVYQKNFDVPTVTLRYFSVYGPRQRPDMAFNRFIDRISERRAIEVYGDGSQMREYTFVDDIVSATLLSMDAKKGSVYNVGSGESVSLREAISILSSIVGREVKVEYSKRASGDVQRTQADISRIKNELGFEPKVGLQDGLRRQLQWQSQVMKG